MSKIIIDSNTVKNPISLIGEMAGPCYGTDISNQEKNYKRGLQCLKDEHFRTLEFAETWFIIEDISARTARQLYTHIGGAPTRLQASTRYIGYKNFEYIVPPAIKANKEAYLKYIQCMKQIQETTKVLQEDYDIKAEDANMILPLGMTTTVACRYNARTLMEMAGQRLCSRTYWEYRQLMKDIMQALSEYSEEWDTIITMFFKCKCDKTGFCLEHKTCGKYPKREE